MNIVTVNAPLQDKIHIFTLDIEFIRIDYLILVKVIAYHFTQF